MNKLKKIQDVHEDKVIKITSESAAKIAKEILRLLPLIQKAQPNITGVRTGMGCWSFTGAGIGYYQDVDDMETFGKPFTIEDDNLEDMLTTPSDWVRVPTNKWFKEFIELMDYFTDSSNEGLNGSTFQAGFGNEGVIFIYSSKTKKDTANPFSIPYKEYFTNDPYYKGLIKLKCPIHFIDDAK